MNQKKNEEENVQLDQPITDHEQEVDKEVIEKIESNEEKAIRIAKEDWGEDETVKFDLEENIRDSKGRYIVNVRDVETTHPLRIYYIDVETEIFEILQ